MASDSIKNDPAKALVTVTVQATTWAGIVLDATKQAATALNALPDEVYIVSRGTMKAAEYARFEDECRVTLWSCTLTCGITSEQ